MVYGGKLHMCTKFEGIIFTWNGEKRQKDTDENQSKFKRKSFQIRKIFCENVCGGMLRKPAKFEVPILKRNGENRQKDTDEFWDKNKRKSFQI